MLHRFELSFAQPVETETVLLPKDTKATGLVTASSVTAGISEKGPWVRISLTFTCSCPEIEEIFGTPEMKFRYEPPIWLDKEGQRLPKQNEVLGRLMEITGINRQLREEPSFAAQLLDGLEQCEGDLTQKLIKAYGNLAKYMEGSRMQVAIGQVPRDNRVPNGPKMNRITTVAALPDEDE